MSECILSANGGGGNQYSFIEYPIQKRDNKSALLHPPNDNGAIPGGVVPRSPTSTPWVYVDYSLCFLRRCMKATGFALSPGLIPC